MTMIQQKDTTFTKLFVGGLPYHTIDQSLREFFQQFGDIDEAVVITDRQTGKSRGYGFVTMSDRSAAERICKDPNPIIDGRKANVNLAYLGAKPRIQVTDLFALPYSVKAAAAAAASSSAVGLPLSAGTPLSASPLTGLPHYIYPGIGGFIAQAPTIYQLPSTTYPTAAAGPAGPQLIEYAGYTAATAAGVPPAGAVQLIGGGGAASAAVDPVSGYAIYGYPATSVQDGIGTLALQPANYCRPLPLANAANSTNNYTGSVYYQP